MRRLALFAIRWHSRPDAEAAEAAHGEPDPEAALRCLHVLKDADALDRVRLASWALDADRLRFPCSRERIGEARRLYAAPHTRVHHYTTGAHIAAIIRSGVIQRSVQDRLSGATAAVWCSTAPEWEDAASRAVCRGGEWMRGSQVDTAEDYAGCYRIEVDPEAAPLGWPQFRVIGQHDPRRVAALLRASTSKPEEWRISVRPIGRRHWRGLEAWTFSYLHPQSMLGVEHETMVAARYPTWVPVTPEAVLAAWDALPAAEHARLAALWRGSLKAAG